MNVSSSLTVAVQIVSAFFLAEFIKLRGHQWHFNIIYDDSQKIRWDTNKSDE